MVEQPQINNRYEIVGRIGEGGMGTVYRGVDNQDQTPVAIKQLKPELLSADPDLLARFAREGEALRLLNHPNIVKVLATIEDDGHHYIIMEYVEGGSLLDLLKQHQRLPIKRVLQVALDLSDALTRAHRLDIIHRDLKPANVLLADDGTPRLTDFGIAYMQEPERVTKTGSVVGTLHYLSPEAFRGDLVDARTDIWAFGVMLFEVLTGQRPFDHPSAASTMMAILTEPPLDLEQLLPECPVALVDLIYRMLEKDPGARIPSVRQVGAALEALLHNLDTADLNAIRTDVPIRFSEMSRFQTPTSAPDVVPHNLPRQPTPFVGREHELEELAKLLNQADTNLVTIMAPGGMGKTRLALQAAEAFLQSDYRGVYVVELAPLNLAEHIITTVADIVGLRFSSGGEPRQQLLDYFKEKRMLLVMDNFEHVLEGATLVGDILAHAPQVKVLATSRERLNLRGETVFTIGGMEFPDWETPADALAYSAVKLFMQAARRAKPGFELVADDLTYVARICRLVRGMPLGIELAAAWVDMLRLEEIADEIGRSLDFLEADLRDLPERHRSLRAVFDYSWDLLSEDERATFARVAVFRGGFSRQAGQSVTGANLKQLTALVNKSLLRRDPETGAYQIHELLREYADEKLEASGESQSVRDAHSAYYLDAVRQRQRDLEGGRQLEALREIESDIENARAAWLWAARHTNIERLASALQAIAMYYDMRGKYAEFDALTQQTAAILRQTGDTSDALRSVLGTILAWGAACSTALLQKERSRKLAGESEALIRESGTVYARGLLAFVQGYWHLTLGEPAESRLYFEEALTIFKELDNRWGHINTLLNLGRSYWFRTTVKTTNFDEARRYLHEAQALQKQTGDICGMAYTVLNLGSVAYLMGKSDESIGITEEALALHRQAGNRHGMAAAMNNLSNQYTETGQYIRAREHRAQEVALRREFGSAANLVWSLLGLAFIDILSGDFERAFVAQREAQALAEKIDNLQWLHNSLRNQGWLNWAMGNYDAAAADYSRQLGIAEALDSTLDVAIGHLFLAMAAVSRKQFDLARAHLEADLQATEALGDKTLLAFLRSLWGWMDYEERRYSDARRHLEQAAAYFQDEASWQLSYHIPIWFLKEFSIRSLVLLSSINREDGDYAAARRCLRQALQVRTFSPPQKLCALAGVADFLEGDSPPERAAELAALVRDHPAAYADTKENMARLLDALRSRLPPAAFAAAVERGHALDIDAEIAAFLAADK